MPGPCNYMEVSIYVQVRRDRRVKRTTQHRMFVSIVHVIQFSLDLYFPHTLLTRPALRTNCYNRGVTPRFLLEFNNPPANRLCPHRKHGSRRSPSSVSRSLKVPDSRRQGRREPCDGTGGRRLARLGEPSASANPCGSALDHVNLPAKSRSNTGYLGFAEHARPFGEGKVSVDDDGCAPIASDDKVDQTSAGKRVSRYLLPPLDDLSRHT